ncbi:MAG: EAL domain-containing protein [Actinomycetota bacterium]|nr:EAL domain-containing protein [Actinomycetota bacterium]
MKQFIRKGFGEMLNSSLFSILFFSSCIVSLASGIFVLLNNRKAPANKCFFALIMAIALWSAGLAIATIAPNAAIAEIWRRFSALGWGTAYSILLHFILILTGAKTILKKWWFYVLMYLPALITVLAFAIPVGINPSPYKLYRTEFGWMNISQNNIWDLIFYAYFISYIIIALVLLLRWGKKSKDKNIKLQSLIVFISILSAFIVGSFTYVFLSSFFPKIPQMAPVVMLIPIIAIYHVLKKYSFRVFEPVERKSSYLNIIITVTIYVIISFILIRFSTKPITIGSIYLNEFVSRGIITQIQMLLSVYLVLREEKPGFIAAVLMNSANLFSSIIYIIRTGTTDSVPGIISYSGVILIIALINNYKNKKTAYIDRINSQKKNLVESEKKLYQMAYYDSLTELPNKDLFFDLLNQSILVAKRNVSLIGVMFIDFDSFKSVNDIGGHAVGDKVLQKVANLISSCLREEDTIARFGGDEFLIKVANIEKIDNLYKTTDRILDAFKKPIVVQDIEYFISASIGVAVYPVDGEDPETLVKNADIAMYLAKEKGKNQSVYFTSDIKDDTIKHLKLTNNLYRALDKNELFLHYQPQVKVETQEITGFEALLRWENEEYGTIPPKTFIPMAEKTGLIRPIGLWVFETACRQLKEFQNNHGKSLTISINLSLLQLKDTGIVDKIASILKNTNTDPKNVQIEITESTAFNEEPYILKRLKELKKLGILISIDDFGTGHSSFSRLKTFPIDLIKIDIEFVHGISSKLQKDTAIIKSIIQIAKNLGVQVLAEGVETEDQFIYLKKSNCDKIQGFYFYKPMPATEINSVLKS